MIGIIIIVFNVIVFIIIALVNLLLNSYIVYKTSTCVHELGHVLGLFITAKFKKSKIPFTFQVKNLNFGLSKSNPVTESDSYKLIFHSKCAIRFNVLSGFILELIYFISLSACVFSYTFLHKYKAAFIDFNEYGGYVNIYTIVKLGFIFAYVLFLIILGGVCIYNHYHSNDKAVLKDPLSFESNYYMMLDKHKDDKVRFSNLKCFVIVTILLVIASFFTTPSFVLSWFMF